MKTEPTNCNEASLWFARQAETCTSTADRGMYRELAKVFKAFGNIPVPAPVLREWTWRGLAAVLDA